MKAAKLIASSDTSPATERPIYLETSSSHQRTFITTSIPCRSVLLKQDGLLRCPRRDFSVSSEGRGPTFGTSHESVIRACRLPFEEALISISRNYLYSSALDPNLDQVIPYEFWQGTELVLLPFVPFLSY